MEAPTGTTEAAAEEATGGQETTAEMEATGDNKGITAETVATGDNKETTAEMVANSDSREITTEIVGTGDSREIIAETGATEVETTTTESPIEWMVVVAVADIIGPTSIETTTVMAGIIGIMQAVVEEGMQDNMETAGTVHIVLLAAGMRPTRNSIETITRITEVNSGAIKIDSGWEFMF